MKDTAEQSNYGSQKGLSTDCIALYLSLIYNIMYRDRDATPVTPMMALKRSGWSEWRSYYGGRDCYIGMTAISVNDWFLIGK